MLIDGSGSVGRSKRKRTSSRKIGEDCKAVLIAAGVVDISRRMNNYQLAVVNAPVQQMSLSIVLTAPSRELLTLAHRSHVCRYNLGSL
jgi:hypothetical protein